MPSRYRYRDRYRHGYSYSYSHSLTGTDPNSNPAKRVFANCVNTPFGRFQQLFQLAQCRGNSLDVSPRTCRYPNPYIYLGTGNQQGTLC